MRIHVGCELSFEFPQATPMIVMLNVHFSRFSDLERPDNLITTPSVPVEGYRDSFGNWCSRLVAPAGRFSLGTDAVVRDGACRTRSFRTRCSTRSSTCRRTPCCSCSAAATAKRIGSRTRRGGCSEIRRSAGRGCRRSATSSTATSASATSTRARPELPPSLHEQHGVCRDYAHLAVTFCRCLNIPARYCTGYISDIGLPPPYAPMDFAAWMEVFLGGRWHTFDPRNNDPRIGRILIAHGRDAADVPLTHLRPGTLPVFPVWAEEAYPNSTLAA